MEPLRGLFVGIGQALRLSVYLGTFHSAKFCFAAREAEIAQDIRQCRLPPVTDNFYVAWFMDHVLLTFWTFQSGILFLEI